VAIPQNGNITVSRLPECKDPRPGPCGPADPAGVVTWLIEPASVDRTIVATTCPLKTDAVLATWNSLNNVWRVEDTCATALSPTCSKCQHDGHTCITL
jgi:hypothetical protein